MTYGGQTRKKLIFFITKKKKRNGGEDVCNFSFDGRTKQPYLVLLMVALDIKKDDRKGNEKRRIWVYKTAQRAIEVEEESIFWVKRKKRK